MIAALLALTLAGCSGSPLSLLTGGGPNIAANVQAGKTNTQTLGTTQNTEVKGDLTVEHLNQTNVDPWIIGALCLFAGFLIPSHREIARYIRTRGRSD